MLHHKPARLPVISVIIGLCLFSAAGFFAGSEYHTWHHERLARRAQDLSGQVAILQQRKTALITQVARLQRDSQVDTHSTDNLEYMLQAREVRLGKLEQELAFYRSLLAPGKKRTGLNIQHLSLSPGQGRAYTYRLVLSRINGGRRQAQGSFDLRIVGTRDNQPAHINLADLNGANEKDLNFAFRYFQRLRGNFILPDGFKPTKVVVKIRSAHNAKATQDHSYAWTEVVARG